jgi:hypothetical protein
MLRIYVIGGPIGAGKTTASRQVATIFQMTWSDDVTFGDTEFLDTVPSAGPGMGLLC